MVAFAFQLSKEERNRLGDLFLFSAFNLVTSKAAVILDLRELPVPLSDILNFTLCALPALLRFSSGIGYTGLSASEFAKLQLSYTVITAPTDGVVSKKSLQVGQFVSAGQMLFSIVSNDQLWVVANFKETQLSKMKVGQEVEVEVDAFEGQSLKGKITSFSRATGAKFSLLPPDNATGNFVKVVQRIPVKIEFTGTPAIEKQLSAGMSVNVAVTL